MIVLVAAITEGRPLCTLYSDAKCRPEEPEGGEFRLVGPKDHQAVDSRGIGVRRCAGVRVAAQRVRQVPETVCSSALRSSHTGSVYVRGIGRNLRNRAIPQEALAA